MNPENNEKFGTGMVLAIAMIVFCAMANGASAAIIGQTDIDDNSGNANYGQRFVASSSVISGVPQLDSITFTKGTLGGPSAGTGVHLDIFAIGTANINTLNFSTLSETANLTYLGSSSNSINYGALTGIKSTPGAALVWTFSGIVLPLDTPLFAVLSTNNANGAFVGASLNIGNFTSGSDATFVNITNADSNPLFGGAATGASAAQDNFYSISYSSAAVVPTPSGLASGLGLIGLAVAHRRRR